MMNRRIRRCVIGIAGVLTSLLVTGCSHKPTSLEIMSGMTNAIAQNSAISMDWQLDCDLNLEAENEEVPFMTEASLAMEGSTWGSFSEQLACTTAELQVEWPGMQIRETLENYTQKKDQKVTDYLKLGETWVKSEKSSQSSDLAQLNILNTLQEFKDILVLSSETVTLQDKTCYEMKAILLPEDLMMVMNEYTDILNPCLETEDATGNFNRLDRYDLDRKSIQLTLYVEEESHLPAGLSISLEERGSGNGKEEGEESETEVEETLAIWDENLDLNVSNVTCEITNARLTAVFADGGDEVPVIPEEAMAAVDYTLFLENRETAGAEGDEEEAYADTLYREDGNWQLLDAYEDGAYSLMEGNNFRIDLVRVYENPEVGPCADLLLVNSGRADLDIYTRGVAVNRTMLPEASMYQHVPAGGEVRYTLKMSSALRHNTGALQDMYLEFEVVDTVNVYVEDVNSGVVIYRVGSTSVEMLHPEESQEPSKEVDASAFLTMSDEEFDALLKEKSQEENSAEDADSIVSLCKQEMTENDTILQEDDHLLVIAKEAVVTDRTYRIPICLVNVSGKNITLDGKDFKNADGVGMKMAMNSVIFDGCRLNSNLMLDLTVQEPETRRTWGLGERTETSSAEEPEMETEEMSEAPEVSESAEYSDVQTTEVTAEISLEEGETGEAVESTEEEKSQYITFSLVAYVLENYPTPEVWFRCDDLMLSYDLGLMN